MGERKIVSKYIPPDFDPALVPRGKKLSSKDGTVPVRMMLPFSVQCSSCHTFLYRGRKFNSKKERMGGPDGTYLGITRWRFYIKCTHCSRPLTFLTDPEHADYEMESGGTRTYEITKDRAGRQQEAQQQEEQAAKEDPLQALETRVLDSQREMADLDNLEEIKAMNARHVQLLAVKGGNDNDSDAAFDADTKAVLNALSATDEKNEDGLTAEDEALVQSIQFGKKKKHAIRRLDEKDEERLEQERKREASLLLEKQHEIQNSKTSMLPVIKVKRKRRVEGNVQPKKPKANAPEVSPNAGSGFAGLLGGYGSDSDAS